MVAPAARLAELVSPEAVDRMLADADEAGVGAEGLLSQLTKTVLERALGAELDDHLGYVKGDPAGNGSGNSRNGSYGKTVTTASGPVRIGVPRDRNGSFEPKIVPKGQRRLGQVDDMILSLYARGMTTRDIQAHLAEVYGAEVSPALISNVTSVVAEEITAWQTRPLDAVYPILYIDALTVKVRDGGTVDNKAAHLAIGVDTDGYKHVLGIWLAAAEDTFLDGRADRAAQPRHQGRPVRVLRRARRAARGHRGHLAQGDRADLRHPPHPRLDAVRLPDDRKKVATALRPIYTAVNEAAAKDALEQLRGVHGKRYPGLLAAWDRAWPQFIPFLEFDTAIRKVIYTTNAIESTNYQLRKIIKNRGHFPDDDAAIKLLYLGIRNITGRHIDGEGLTLQRGERGTGTLGWKRALNALAVRFGDRLPV